MTLSKHEVERIRQEAISAARKYSDLDSACPYSHHSEAAIIFGIVFMVQQWAKYRFF